MCFSGLPAGTVLLSFECCVCLDYGCICGRALLASTVCSWGETIDDQSAAESGPIVGSARLHGNKTHTRSGVMHMFYVCIQFVRMRRVQQGDLAGEMIAARGQERTARRGVRGKRF